MISWTVRATAALFVLGAGVARVQADGPPEIVVLVDPSVENRASAAIELLRAVAGETEHVTLLRMPTTDDLAAANRARAPRTRARQMAALVHRLRVPAQPSPTAPPPAQSPPASLSAGLALLPSLGAEEPDYLVIMDDADPGPSVDRVRLPDHWTYLFFDDRSAPATLLGPRAIGAVVEVKTPDAVVGAVCDVIARVRGMRCVAPSVTHPSDFDRARIEIDAEAPAGRGAVMILSDATALAATARPRRSGTTDVSSWAVLDLPPLADTPRRLGVRGRNVVARVLADLPPPYDIDIERIRGPGPLAIHVRLYDGRRRLVSAREIAHAYRLHTILDGRPVAWSDEGETQVVHARADAPGKHLLRARLVPVAGGASARADQEIVIAKTVDLGVVRAGSGVHCARVDTRVRARVDLGRVRLGARSSSWRLWSRGDLICAAAPAWELLRPGRIEVDLGTTANGAPITLTGRLVPDVWIPIVPILLFVAGVLSMLLLRRKTRALPTRDVTHIAWGRALSRGYRESDRPQWTVAELGDLAAPLALRSLDEALGPCSVSVARDERAVYVDAGATVVAVPASGAPLLQVGAFRAPAGTILVDGDLLVALLDATTAARVREGTTTIEAPEPRAVARARRTGFVGQLIADAPPEPLEIAALLVAPTIATAIGTVAPIMLHELFPFASTRGGFFVVSAAVAIALLAATHLLGRPVQVRRHGQSASHS